MVQTGATSGCMVWLVVWLCGVAVWCGYVVWLVVFGSLDCTRISSEVATQGSHSTTHLHFNSDQGLGLLSYLKTTEDTDLVTRLRDSHCKVF